MTSLPSQTITVEEFIQAGSKTTIDYMNLSFLDRLQNGTIVSVLNVVNDYIEELRNACLTVELTEGQQYAYFYKPKLLCHDVYGTPEVYYVILLINDMADVKEFTKPVIKMLKKEHMSMLMSYIYNAEIKAINTYNDKEVHHNDTVRLYENIVH